MTEIWDYIEAHSSKEPDYLKTIVRDTHLHVLNPRMLCGQVEGRLLSILAKLVRAKRILELGTFTGYSALCLAESGAEVITIDHNDELEDTVLHNLSLSDYGQNVKPLIGDALTLLPTLSEEITRGEKAPFDLIFLDADKREYPAYLDTILNNSLIHSGSLILADNVLWDNHITDPAYDKDKQTIGLRAFNDMVAKDIRLEKVILPLRDGLTLIRVK